MPGSATVFNGSEESSQQLQRVPIVARAGGGVYVAYPSGYPTTNQVRLWRIADNKSSAVATRSSSATGGRLKTIVTLTRRVLA